MLQPVAGQPRQPVVGVDRVRVGLGPQVLAHPVGVLLDDLGELLLHQVGWPGGHVHHLEAGLDLDHVGQVVAPPPHVHARPHTGLGQRGHELTDVDVHAPAVAGARLGERRGVQGEDGEGAHGGS